MIRRPSSTLTGLLLLAVTAIGTYSHGRLTGRWTPIAAELAQAGTAIQKVPNHFGDWQLQSETPFDDRVLGILNPAGATNRVYVNKVAGKTVSMAMIVGAPGPTSTHVAELCYPTAGYKLLGKPTDVAIRIGDTTHEFRTTLFEPPQADALRLEVYTSWRQADAWRAPASPRMTFGGGAYLFKLQVASTVHNESASSAESTCQTFLKALIPALDQTVFRSDPARSPQ